MKRILIVVLCVLSLSTLAAEELYIFGNNDNVLVQSFIAALRSNISREEIIPGNEDGFVILDIVDHGVLETSEGSKRLLTVIFGAGEERNEWIETPSGLNLRNYFPLKTIVVFLDESNSTHSIDAGVNLVTEKIGEFIEQLQPAQRANQLRMMIANELQIFASQVVQYYKTPLSQGGAGQNLDRSSTRQLASFLGWDINDMSYRVEGDIVFKIEDVSDTLVTLSGTHQSVEYNKGPLFYIHITLPEGTLNTILNPVYGDK